MIRPFTHRDPSRVGADSGQQCPTKRNQSKHSCESPVSVFFVTLFYRHGALRVAEVIIQVWITSLLGVISERLLAVDENILFIRGTFAGRWGSVKGIRAILSLLASGPAFARQR